MAQEMGLIESKDMKIKFLREVLKHYEDHQYDDWEINLFDYNNQRSLHLADGVYSASKETKTITFPTEVEPVDGETIDNRIRRIMDEWRKMGEEIRNGLGEIKSGLYDFKEDIKASGEEIKKKL
jgi:hypothetical protein